VERAARGRRHLRALRGVAGLTLPSVPEYAEPAWHLFVVRHPRRDALREHLERAGVGTLVHYPVPPHRQPAYSDLGLAEGSFPVSEAMAREILSLPVGPHLSDAQADHVVSAVASFGGGI
jgi:dTDP-4-amino-4,6-dideoxygalactose transaminase